MNANPKIGRADAFRVSMHELIEKGSAFEAHPSQWHGPWRRIEAHKPGSSPSRVKLVPDTRRLSVTQIVRRAGTASEWTC